LTEKNWRDDHGAFFLIFGQMLVFLGQDQNNKQYNQVMERIMNEVCPYCGSNEINEGDTENDIQYFQMSRLKIFTPSFTEISQPKI